MENTNNQPIIKVNNIPFWIMTIISSILAIFVALGSGFLNSLTLVAISTFIMFLIMAAIPYAAMKNSPWRKILQTGIIASCAYSLFATGLMSIQNFFVEKLANIPYTEGTVQAGSALVSMFRYNNIILTLIVAFLCINVPFVIAFYMREKKITASDLKPYLYGVIVFAAFSLISYFISAAYLKDYIINMSTRSHQ